jgi:transposase InsO family protein
MSREIEQERIWAVQRFLTGEKPAAICASLGRSRAWLYKWVQRFRPEDPAWCQAQSRQPYGHSRRTSAEVEELVKLVRLRLYNTGLFCGAQAIQWELDDLGVRPLPSVRSINRILSRHGLTHRRTGRYVPKGKPYPKLPAGFPNQTHQADFVGPCYLQGPIRFYSLNVVDVHTGRCAVEPLPSYSAQHTIDGFWANWRRLGIPRNLQVDNAMVFYGSPSHPRGMGPLIRLCLHHQVEPWFIPPSEPWRNGVVEKFNDHYEQKLLARVTMTTEAELKQGSLDFEHKHNSRYRYSKLGGQTPLQALAGTGRKLSFPSNDQAPHHPLKKPETGRYHLVRYIRSNLQLNIFGELFAMPPDLQYQYVVATVDVKEQTLKVRLAQQQVAAYEYSLR